MNKSNLILFDCFANALKNNQSVFEVYTDEEFHNTKYVKANNKTVKECFLHVMRPNSTDHLIKVYFHEKWVGVVVNQEFENFKTKIYCDPYGKVYEYERSIRLNIDDVHYLDFEEMIKKTYELVIELMIYSFDVHPEYNSDKSWGNNSLWIQWDIPDRNNVHS